MRHTIWEHFHRRSLILQTADGRQIRPVLVFDQFEELFAIGQASEATPSGRGLPDGAGRPCRKPGAEALERRLDDDPDLVKQFVFDDRDYRILVCLREDYLAHLESLRQSMPSSTENRMRLTRMNGTRALEAVTFPGRDSSPRERGPGRAFRGRRGDAAAESAGHRRDDDGLQPKSSHRS